MTRGPQTSAAAACVLLAAALAAPARAQVTVDRWLVAGPVPARRPALAASDSSLLEAGSLEVGPRWPAAGDTARWLGSRSLTWEARTAGSAGRLSLSAPSSGGGEAPPALVHALAYLRADRWQRAEIRVEAGDVARVRLDGEAVSDGQTVSLEQGAHLLEVRAARPRGAAADWSLRAALEPRTEGAGLTASVNPRRPPDWSDLRSGPRYREVAVAPGGDRAAVVVRRTDLEADRRVSRLQVRSLADGSVEAGLPVASGVSDLAWSPGGERLAFTAPAADGERGKDLWVWRPGGGRARRPLRSERGLSNLLWGPDGEWMYFTATVKRPVDRDPDDGMTRLTEVWHRWSYWPRKAHLYAYHLRDGTRHELVGGPRYSVSAPALSPDGERLVFTRNVRSATRPYVRSEVRLLDLPSGESRTLVTLEEEAFGGPAAYAWSPDGRAVAFCASVTESLPGENPETSRFEMELYALPVADPEPVRLSRGFTPAVGQGGSCRDLHWSPADRRIYVAAEDGARTVPAGTREPVDPGAPEGRLRLVDPPAPVMGAHHARLGTLVGSFESPVRSPALYRVELPSGRASQLHAPGLAAAGQLEMPGWKPWSFTDSDGWEIEGWYWTPSGFDPDREYPLVVHYYGGTLAQKKGFDEQLLWYASKGYVVFMLNPAGAPGYGQAFSDLHVGDWGYPAGTDVIEGVREFASAHDFVDADRIGNFGGSYGGFLTMHLLARTDTLFAAAAERAGISNITGYWGAGWWGYSYTEGTCPGCYPWNRRDVFVDRSPIFHADEIRTPLLILHGTDDHNVVPTESEQIFTALRVLGRKAEMVRFHGEGHGISSSPAVRRKFERVILEWFDRHLRDRPAAWRARWGGEDDE